MAEEQNSALVALETRLQEVQKLARIGIWEWSIPDDELTWSDELFRIHGFEPGDFQPTRERTIDCFHPDDRSAAEDQISHALLDTRPFELVARARRADGSEFLLRSQVEVTIRQNGAPLRMLGVCEDVTDRIRAQQAEARLADIVQSANDAIYTVGPDEVVTSWNPGAERLFGYTTEEMVGNKLEILYVDGYRESPALDKLRERVRAGVRGEPFEVQRRSKNGEVIDVSITVSTMHDERGRAVGASAIARDVSERRRIEEQLEHLAGHDTLTGLFNRRRFEEELTAACARVERDGTGGAVLMIDLDNFKYINDRFGHAAGDAFLSGIAAAISKRLRETDTLARLGGDEFGVVAAPATLDQAEKLAVDLLTVIRDHAMSVESHTVRTSASVGVVAFDGRAVAAETLLADVDRAMYSSKDSGRDRATAVSSDQRNALRARMRASWEHLIMDALDHDHFELYCQPIMDLVTGEHTHCEVLLRMRAGADVVLPGAFLGTAERLGLIHAIDHWVIARAIEAAAQHPDIKFELNLSGRTTDDENLPRYIERQLGKFGTDPANMVFELTETAAIGNISRARKLATALTRIGCSFAIDDFGAGFSTFYYLKHFPAQYLKIDGDFVRTPRSRTDDLVIDSIVRIAQDLGKQTIAEFVVDEDTLTRMRELGVDYGQGFHIAEPFPLAELSLALS